MSKAEDFKIQIPQSIVRDKRISSRTFVVLGKLIQRYYMQPNDKKELTFSLDHKGLMYQTEISTTRILLGCLKEMHSFGVIENEINTIPRKNKLIVTISNKVVPELNDEQLFVQLENYVFHRSIIKEIGYVGIRILYYIRSYINYKTLGKDHSFVSLKKMANDLGISDTTLKKYIKKLEKNEFIKVERHKAKQIWKEDRYGIEGLLWERLNNNYYINHENFKRFVEERLHQQ